MAAIDRAAALEDDNRSLVNRLLEQNRRDVERMDEINRLSEEMVRA